MEHSIMAFNTNRRRRCPSNALSKDSSFLPKGRRDRAHAPLSQEDKERGHLAVAPSRAGTWEIRSAE